MPRMSRYQFGVSVERGQDFGDTPFCSSLVAATGWHVVQRIEREGRIPSAERAVPTHPQQTEGYEPSFSLIRADSRQ